jgi:outer membrane protein insertion porin family
MIKILIKSYIFYFLFLSISFSEKINQIEVYGNKRISNESIIIFSKLKVGDNYDQNIINNSLKELYNTNFFKDIKITPRDNIIRIDIVENPIIESVNIEGVKNKNLLNLIKENLTLRERSSFNQYLLNKDISLINNILKRSGFYFSSLKSSLTTNEKLNSISLTYQINLGKKAKIQNISFIGNNSFKMNKLLEVIASEENKFWKFVSNKKYLNENLINLDKRLLKNFYNNRGFYNVKILETFAELDKNKNSFNLIYNIDEGEKFTFSNFNLLLPDDYLEKDFEGIKKVFSKNINNLYSLSTVTNIVDELENISSNKFYDFIDVKIEEKIIDNNKLDISFIVSDSSKFYIERINLAGNYNTIEEVIRNNLIVDEGDPLNNLLFNKSINNIKGLDIFKEVNAEIKNGSNENFKVIDIIVEEKPTGEISLAAGYGTNGISSGGSIKEKNFLGKGINLNTNLEISEESLKGQFIYSKPNFAYTDNTLFTSLRSINNDFISLYGYETDEFGLSFGTKFEQFENLFFSPEIDLSFEDLSTNSNASENLKKQEGNYTDFYFNYSLDYDLRDTTFNPKKGFISIFSQELPIVSENNEISNAFNFTTYKELNSSNEMIGRASFYFKSINTIDGSDVRISKRSFLPYSKLRGFEKGKIGPLDNNDYIGGNYASSLNLSTNLPSLFPTIEILDFNYFIDIANVWGVDYNSSLDKSEIRSSTGIGLNV